MFVLDATEPQSLSSSSEEQVRAIGFVRRINYVFKDDYCILDLMFVFTICQDQFLSDSYGFLLSTSELLCLYFQVIDNSKPTSLKY